MSGICRSCRAPIVWAETASGKRIPVDADPHEHGNIVLEDVTEQTPRALIGKVASARVGEPKHRFHLCPNADEGRNR